MSERWSMQYYCTECCTFDTTERIQDTIFYCIDDNNHTVSYGQRRIHSSLLSFHYYHVIVIVVVAVGLQWCFAAGTSAAAEHPIHASW